jgi:hypothetical protein
MRQRFLPHPHLRGTAPQALSQERRSQISSPVTLVASTATQDCDDVTLYDAGEAAVNCGAAVPHR